MLFKPCFDVRKTGSDWSHHVTWKACRQPCLLQVMQAPVAALLSLPCSSQM